MREKLKKSVMNDGNAINHCGLSSQGKADFANIDDIKEAVMIRADQLVRAAQTGDPPPDATHPVTELLAGRIAETVLNSGARQVASDLDIDLDKLGTLATSKHISSC